MTVEIDLSGDDWRLRGCLGDTYLWYVGPAHSHEGVGWHAAHVPGSVLDDLWRAGEVPDPYYERNTLLLEWVPQRAWVYRRTISTPPLAPDEQGVLAFDGVDHAADVYLDGTLVGTHEGGLSPFACDITAHIRHGGEHLLAVVVQPAPQNEPQVGDTTRVRVHKSRMGYGWDFCPRLIHQGIWQRVVLRCGTDAGWSPSPEVRYDVSGECGRVTVAGADRLTLSDGEMATVAVEGGVLTVERPHLWWPNGAGDAHCYELYAERGGRRERFTIGFCELALEPNPGGPAGARAYTLVANGRPLYLKGWNWVPVDACYGADRHEKLVHLLELAAHSGANCLRVWGGGIIETPSFYEECDRLGLLVWQEFSLSSSGISSVPSDDPAYLEMMRRESRAIIPTRRHHPSLAIWCGGNELARPMPDRDDLPLEESTPVLEVLAAAVAELDSARSFLPTSPSGPRFLNRLDIIATDPDGQHDVHGPWEHQGLSAHQRLYDAGTALWHSEVGVEGMTNRRALDRLVSADHRWPADRSNPVYEHLGAWWNNARLVQDAFGHRLDDVDSLRRASQHLQHDGLRYAVEANLRRAPRSSGVWPWQLNESYPNAWCTASVDYYGDPKPAYYGVRRAYRPAHACAAFPTPAWQGSDEVHATIVAWGGPAIVSARLVTVEGRTLASEEFELDDGAAPRSLGELRLPPNASVDGVFLIDISLTTARGEVVRNRYVNVTGADFGPLCDLERADVAVTLERGALALRHLGGPGAIGLVLEDARAVAASGWISFADNLIDLLPGEEISVPLEPWGITEDECVVRVQGWNTDAFVVATGDAKTSGGTQ